MKLSSVLTMGTLLVVLLAIAPFAQAQEWLSIDGTPDSNQQWGSAWLDLPEVTNFKKNDRLQLKIDGPAQKVVIRLLPETASPDQAVGIIGSYPIPASRIIEVTLNEDHLNVKQISVHGGAKAWSIRLGESNGPATLVSVKRAQLRDQAEAQAPERPSIDGTIGSDEQWGSAWLDLSVPTNFKKDERLQLRIDGSVKKVVVRLLPEGELPDKRVGILGAYVIPESRVLEVALKENHNRVKQISVHGGSKAWEIRLPDDNGPATLAWVKRAP